MLKFISKNIEFDKFNVTLIDRGMSTKILKEKLEGFEKLTGMEPVMFVKGVIREANVEKDPDWDFTRGVVKVKSVGTKYICIEVGKGEPGDSGYLREKERFFYPDGLPIGQRPSYSIRAKTKVEYKTEY